MNCKEIILPFQKDQDENPEQMNTTSHNIKDFFHSINNVNEIYTNNDDVDYENDNDNPEINCKYIDVDSFNYKENAKNLSLFHLNIASLCKHKEELEYILNQLNFKFYIIGITETKTLKEINPIFDYNLKGYNAFHTATESHFGGTLLYVSDNLKAKQRKDIETKLYKSKELESTFVEIINQGKRNIKASCIYRHSSMDLDNFNHNFLNYLMQSLVKEAKNVFLMGDFNVDLLKINHDNQVSHFFDILSSNLFIPHIIHPTRINMNSINQRTSKTLIDNIFHTLKLFRRYFG